MPSASDLASMKRLSGEIDQANRRIADNNKRVADENVTLARKNQEYNRVAVQPPSGARDSQLRSIKSAMDLCQRRNAGYAQKSAQELSTIARKTAEYNRYASKP